MGIMEEAINKSEELRIIPKRLEILDNQLNSFIKDGQRQAIIFKAVKNGVNIFEGVYGINTKEYGLKMDTIFNVCSITKPVIASLILCLQEDGLLDISDPVYKYLPEFVGEGKEKICVWHFLTHTSGLEDNEIFEYIKDYIENTLKINWPKEDASNEEYREFEEKVIKKLKIEKVDGLDKRFLDGEYILSLKLEMKRNPRSNMSYCNYGYQRLADIIRVVSGEDLDNYAKRKIFEPLNMVDTAWVMQKEKWNRIIGRIEGAVSSEWFNSEENFISESGSGGLKTTVNDMIRFTRMILNKGELDGVRVLSKASINQMFINHNKGVNSIEGEEYSGWSLGWNLHGNKKDSDGVLRSNMCIDHTGYGGSKIFIDPKYSLTMVFFAVETVYFEKPEFININGRIVNMVMSAMDD